MLPIIIAYIFVGLIVGLLGRSTAAGFGGTFLLSLIISPVLTLLFLMLMRPNKRDRISIMQARLDQKYQD
jgi:hypothetical protein